MGLDIKACAFRNDKDCGRSPIDEQFHCWRKHQALLDWCSALAVARGLPAWDEPAESILLEERDLDRLEAAVKNGELPDYFEPEPPGLWQSHDLIFIAKARALMTAGFQVEIVASW